MMQGMMECCGGGWGHLVMMGIGVLLLVLVLLGIAALAKYVFRGSR